jgi:hypothetical protein
MEPFGVGRTPEEVNGWCILRCRVRSRILLPCGWSEAASVPLGSLRRPDIPLHVSTAGHNHSTELQMKLERGKEMSHRESERRSRIFSCHAHPSSDRDSEDEDIRRWRKPSEIFPRPRIGPPQINNNEPAPRPDHSPDGTCSNPRAPYPSHAQTPHGCLVASSTPKLHARALLRRAHP